MGVGIDDFRSAKDFLFDLPTKVKIFVVIGILGVVAGSALTGALISSKINKSPLTATTSLDAKEARVDTTEQSDASGNAVLAVSDQDSSGQDGQGAVENQQSPQSGGDNQYSAQVASTTLQSAQSTSQPNEQSSDTPISSNPEDTSASSESEDQPVVQKADYNLNDSWYFAAAFSSGPFNECWPEPFTAENESRCFGVIMDFVGIGIDTTAQTATEKANNDNFRKAEEAHAEPRKGGPLVEATLLTAELCTQYELSCGSW